MMVIYSVIKEQGNNEWKPRKAFLQKELLELTKKNNLFSIYVKKSSNS